MESLISPTSSGPYKGCGGRLAIFGGSTEYVGAAYFAAKSALYQGIDLVYIFTVSGASTPLKTMLPDAIIYPAAEWSKHSHHLTEDALGRFDAFLVGCGIGRDDSQICHLIERLISHASMNRKTVVLDGDALWYCSTCPSVLQTPGRCVVLTPNHVELGKLLRNGMNLSEFFVSASNVKSVIAKGEQDQVFNHDGTQYILEAEVSTKWRKGGQGDVLAGSLAALWAIAHSAPRREMDDAMSRVDEAQIAKSIAQKAGKMVRKAAYEAEAEFGRAFSIDDLLSHLKKMQGGCQAVSANFGTTDAADFSFIA